MTTPTHRHPPLPTKDAARARAAIRLLAQHAREDRPLTLGVRNALPDTSIELPSGAVAPLLDMLETLAGGRGIAIVPEDAELSTMDAADVLRVSRPFLIKLLDNGEIPYRKVGKHRRIRVDDLLDYKARDDRKRAAVLDELAREAQEQDMGYRQP